MNPLTWQNPEQLFVAQVLKKIFYNSVAELRFMISYGNQFSNLFLLKTALVTLLSVEILSAIILFIRLIFYR